MAIVPQLKIPAVRFDDAINGLQPIGHLESVSVSAADVGEEFVDVAARAANGRKLEQRLIDILGSRTGKLSDVLAVERELARVREEIERQEGRMRLPLGAIVAGIVWLVWRARRTRRAAGEART